MLAGVFVVAAPPLIWGTLGPTGWGIFPGFLAAQGSEVEESPDTAERFDAAAIGKISAIDLFPFSKEDTETEPFAFGGGDTEVTIKIAAVR